jgi:hypothetical protein
MKIAELLDENIFAKGLSAIKNIGSKVVPTAVKNSDDAKAAAALRANQDARMNALGRPKAPIMAFKSGDTVDVNLRAYKNQSQYAMSANFPFKGKDNEIAKVIEIIPHPTKHGAFLAKLETIPGKATSQATMYKGQSLGNKMVTPEAEKFTMPLEFITKRP